MDNIAKYAPPFWYEINEYKIVWDIETHFIEQLYEDILKVFNNCFCQSMDETETRKFEKLFQLKPEVDETLESRRLKVMMKIASMPPFTNNYLRDVLKTFFNDCVIEKDAQHNKLEIKITERNANLSTIKTILSAIIAAHIIWLIKLKLTTHGQLKRYKHGDLKAYTHGQIKALEA